MLVFKRQGLPLKCIHADYTFRLMGLPKAHADYTFRSTGLPKTSILKGLEQTEHLKYEDLLDKETQ